MKKIIALLCLLALPAYAGTSSSRGTSSIVDFTNYSGGLGGCTVTNSSLSCPMFVPTASGAPAGSGINLQSAGQMGFYSGGISQFEVGSGVVNIKSNLTLYGSSSGTLTLLPAATASGTLTLPAGTTDFSATGGASKVVMQTSAGGAFTVAQLAASNLSNGTTGSNAVVLATSPTLVTPVLGAASATSLSFSSTSGIIGTTTNDNAAAGSVGELITANASGVALTTGTAKTVTSISLTAGDWDVRGNCGFVPNAATTITEFGCGISTTNNTLPGSYTAGSQIQMFATFATGTSNAFSLAPMRISVSGTTTVYLVQAANFAVNTMSASAWIEARRVR